MFPPAFAVATIDAKSVAGHLAAFSQLVGPGVPIGSRMGAVVPSAPSPTATSDAGCTGLGAGLGRMALGFVAYGVALGTFTPGRAG